MKYLKTILLTGLSLISFSSQASVQKDILVDKNFESIHIGGTELDGLKSDKPLSISFQLKDDNLIAFGNAGCNNYRGQVSLENDSLYMRQMLLTRMMCMGDGSKIEKSFVILLNSNNHVTFENNILTIKNENIEFQFKEIK